MAKAEAPFVLPNALLQSFETNERINQYLIANLPEEAWRAQPPESKGRNLAGIVAHMHNVRVMWLKAAARSGKIPDQLDRSSATPALAAKALGESHAALAAAV